MGVKKDKASGIATGMIPPSGYKVGMASPDGKCLFSAMSMAKHARLPRTEGEKAAKEWKEPEGPTGLRFAITDELLENWSK